MKSRIRSIFKRAPKTVDAIVLFNAEAPHMDMSFFYATDLVEGGLFEGGGAVIHRDGSCQVLSSLLEEQSARKGREAEVLVFTTGKERTEHLKKSVGKAKTIGINAHELTYQNFLYLKKALPGRKFVDVTDAVMKARLYKDEVELERLRRACKLVSKVGDEIPKMLVPGMTEMELSAEINDRMQRYGASGPSFQTIVAFGENAAEPHYSPAERRLKKGDYVLCDFGAFYKMYASDITRTFVFGRATKEMRTVYEIVQEAQEVGFKMIHHGAKASDVHMAVEKVINSTKYKGRFIHSTGHSIGLAVHDGGRIAALSDTTLEETMAFTVEPGIYVPKWGGVRIEDDVVVTKTGCKMLTTAGRDLVEV
jgi:Xaa-Pro dipeptidase